RELRKATSLGFGPLLLGARVALKHGDRELANNFIARPVGVDLMATTLRLVPGAEALLDAPPFAPRRRDATLVWPLEAPMPTPEQFELFRDVKIESARPKSSSVLGSLAPA